MRKLSQFQDQLKGALKHSKAPEEGVDGSDQEDRIVETMDSNLPKEMREDLHETFDVDDKAYELPCCFDGLVNLCLRRKPLFEDEKPSFNLKTTVYQILALVIGGIETVFMLTCLILYGYHYITYIPKYRKSNTYKPSSDNNMTVALGITVPFAIGLLWEVVYAFGVIFRKLRPVIKYHAVFQCLLGADLILIGAFTYCIDHGSEDNDKDYLAQYNPPIIRFLSFLSAAYVFLQIILYFILQPIVRYLIATNLYREEIMKNWWKHISRTFYASLDIMYQSAHTTLFAPEPDNSGSPSATVHKTTKQNVDGTAQSCQTMEFETDGTGPRRTESTVIIIVDGEPTNYAEASQDKATQISYTYKTTSKAGNQPATNVSNGHVPIGTQTPDNVTVIEAINTTNHGKQNGAPPQVSPRSLSLMERLRR